MNSLELCELATANLFHLLRQFQAYIVLALIVLLGAGTPTHGEYYFKIAFTFFHLLACFALAIDVYYMGGCPWKSSESCPTISLFN